jgi:polysaccharide export outer membrane protein
MGRESSLRQRLLVVLIALVAIAPGCAPKNQNPTRTERRAYRITPTDELRILVIGHTDLTGSQKVSTDGNVTLPWIGAVKAEGATETELAKEIAARLADGWLKDPQVIVSVAAFGESIYVVGEVTKPGAYPFQPNLTVLQALALAGGATPRAAPSRARVLRPLETGGSPQVVHVQPGDPLLPDDVLVVPERVF